MEVEAGFSGDETNVREVRCGLGAVAGSFEANGFADSDRVVVDDVEGSGGVVCDLERPWTAGLGGEMGSEECRGVSWKDAGLGCSMRWVSCKVAGAEAACGRVGNS
jgi:hypothetical protein